MTLLILDKVPKKEKVVGPTPTQLGSELYAACGPLTYADAKLGYPLLQYLDALVQAAQQAATYGRDNGSRPGWGILMDPATCPEEALQWLGQLAGVNVEELKRALIIAAQNLIYVPNFSRTALAAAPAKWTNADTAATTFKVTEGWAGRKSLEIITAAMASGVTNAALAQGPIKLPGHEKSILVTEGEHYSFRSTINVTSITGTMNFTGRIKWFSIGGGLISTSVIGAPITAVGVNEIAEAVTAPALAVAAEISFVVSESKAAASKATLFLDKCAFSPSPKNIVLPYGDGDTVGWTWSGTAGESPSSELKSQSDAEYVQAKRNLIKELPAEERGTPQAIIAAVKQYLTGNKTVFLRERDGGAYKLTVVTYESETPNSAQVKAVLEQQVPGGIIFTYASVPGATYIIVHASYATYKAIGPEKAFLTYNGLRNNQPGT